MCRREITLKEAQKHLRLTAAARKKLGTLKHAIDRLSSGLESGDCAGLYVVYAYRWLWVYTRIFSFCCCC